MRALILALAAGWAMASDVLAAEPKKEPPNRQNLVAPYTQYVTFYRVIRGNTAAIRPDVMAAKKATKDGTTFRLSTTGVTPGGSGDVIEEENGTRWIVVKYDASGDLFRVQPAPADLKIPPPPPPPPGPAKAGGRAD